MANSYKKFLLGKIYAPMNLSVYQTRALNNESNQGRSS